MSSKRKDFAVKARHIVGGTAIPKPQSLQDFLDDEGKTVNTENRTSTVREAVNTDNTAAGKKTEREEFRFEFELAERLRRCAFETRRKKTDIAREALDRYLSEQGF
jgi:hypothetical protein